MASLASGTLDVESGVQQRTLKIEQRQNKKFVAICFAVACISVVSAMVGYYAGVHSVGSASTHPGHGIEHNTAFSLDTAIAKAFHVSASVPSSQQVAAASRISSADPRTAGRANIKMKLAPKKLPLTDLMAKFNELFESKGGPMPGTRAPQAVDSESMSILTEDYRKMLQKAASEKKKVAKEEEPDELGGDPAEDADLMAKINRIEFDSREDEDRIDVPELLKEIEKTVGGEAKRTSFFLSLKSVPEEKQNAVVKVLRELQPEIMGHADAEELSEDLPLLIGGEGFGLPLDTAQKIERALRNAGAEVELI